MAKIVIEAIESKMGQEMLGLGGRKTSADIAAPKGAAIKQEGGASFQDIYDAVMSFDAVIETLKELADRHPEVEEALATSGVFLDSYINLNNEFKKFARERSPNRDSPYQPFYVPEGKVGDALKAIGGTFKKAAGKAKDIFKGNVNDAMYSAASKAAKAAGLELLITTAEEAMANLPPSARTKAAEDALATLRSVYGLQSVKAGALAQMDREQAQYEVEQQKAPQALKKGAAAYGSAATYNMAAQQLLNYESLDPEQKKELAAMLRQLAGNIEKKATAESDRSRTTNRTVVIIKDR